MARSVAFFVLLAWAALSPTLADGRGSYRWVDSNGVVHYSDQPPPESAPVPATPAPAAPPAVNRRRQTHRVLPPALRRNCRLR